MPFTSVASRRVRLLALGAALVLALSGCVKVDLSLAIGEDHLNGVLVVAYDKAVAAKVGGRALINQLQTEAGSKRPGTSAAPYDDGTYAGVKLTFINAPLNALAPAPSAASTDAATAAAAAAAAAAIRPFAITITHDRSAGTYSVTGNLDVLKGRQLDPKVLPDIKKSLHITVSLTFPGRVVSTNGVFTRNTVSWDLSYGKDLTIRAVAEDQPSHAVAWALAIGGFVALLVAAATLWSVLRRRRRRRNPMLGHPLIGHPQYQPYAGHRP